MDLKEIVFGIVIKSFYVGSIYCTAVIVETLIKFKVFCNLKCENVFSNSKFIFVAEIK
jgi:hypothetical protein